MNAKTGRSQISKRRPLLSVSLCLVLVSNPAAVPRPDIDIRQGCVTAECHGDLKQAEFLHGPVNLNECEPCHTAINDRHIFKDIKDPSESCQVCHDIEESKSVVHEPFAADCTACHDPHQADNRYFVKGGTGAEGCNKCHEDVRGGLAHLHGPVALGECLACHTPHQSDHASLLIEPRAELCLGCHIDVAHSLDRAVSHHEPVSKDCAGCHEPHGGPTEFFLPAEGEQLCRSCHTEFFDNMGSAQFGHESMIVDGDCLKCHAPHAAPRTHLLEQNTGDLCLTCHDKQIVTDTRTIENIKAQFATAKFLHGPLREDNNCSACHEAHGSDSSRLLDKEFPEEFYTSFEPEKYDLCFECHDRRIIVEERSIVTEFRNGEENLHYLHVNREKGRSCRACHHEHASSQPNHVRSEVPFGRWMMKVEYDKTETGGSCSTGCHLPYKYDRESPIENSEEIAP